MIYDVACFCVCENLQKLFEVGVIGNYNKSHIALKFLFGVNVYADTALFLDGNDVNVIFLTKIELDEVFAHPLFFDGEFNHNKVF